MLKAMYFKIKHGDPLCDVVFVFMVIRCYCMQEIRKIKSLLQLLIPPKNSRISTVLEAIFLNKYTTINQVIYASTIVALSKIYNYVLCY